MKCLLDSDALPIPHLAFHDDVEHRIQFTAHTFRYSPIVEIRPLILQLLGDVVFETFWDAILRGCVLAEDRTRNLFWEQGAGV